MTSATPRSAALRFVWLRKAAQRSATLDAAAFGIARHRNEQNQGNARRHIVPRHVARPRNASQRNLRSALRRSAPLGFTPPHSASRHTAPQRNEFELKENQCPDI